MTTSIRSFLANPAEIFGSLAVISAFALGAALTSQFMYGLLPCELCLYQRMPFIAVIVLSLFGLAFRRNLKISALLLAFCALAFLINTGIAAYHTGVELRWWESAAEGCKVPDMNSGDDDWITKMLSRPSVPCSAIQWKDPVLGLTMANYNALLCLALFCLSLVAALLWSRHETTGTA